MKHVNIPIFIPHLGCPFTCIFCNQRQIAAQQSFPPAAVAAMVDKHLATIRPGSEVEIAFFGGSFTMMDMKLQEAYLRQVYPYLKSGQVHGLRLSTRPDGISPANLEMLRHWGVDTVELGVQSCDDEVLNRAGREMKRADIVAACHLIKEYAFKLGIQLMVGLPGDDRGKALDTAQTTIELQADMVRIYPTLVITGTELARLWQNGLYQPLSLSAAVSICADMLLLFQYNNIPVIRIGLQPNQDLNCPETMLAGPYHPSFGELVEQHIFCLQARELLNNVQITTSLPEPVRLLVNPRDMSRMIGQHRLNVLHLEKEYNLQLLQVIAAADINQNNLGLLPPGGGEAYTLERKAFIGRLMNRGLIPPYRAAQSARNNQTSSQGLKEETALDNGRNYA